MLYQTKIIRHDEFIEIMVGSGDDKSEVPDNSVIESIISESLEKYSGRIAINIESLTRPVPELESFRFGTTLSEIAKGKNIKVAFITNKYIKRKDNFFENVVTNRGLNLKVFTDSDEAINWLTSSIRMLQTR